MDFRSRKCYLENCNLKLQNFGYQTQGADSVGKTLMLGKTEPVEGRRGSGQQDEMVGGHPRLSGQDFEQAPGDGGSRRSRACCRPQGGRESDTATWRSGDSHLRRAAAAFLVPLILLPAELVLEAGKEGALSGPAPCPGAPTPAVCSQAPRRLLSGPPFRGALHLLLLCLPGIPAAL